MRRTLAALIIVTGLTAGCAPPALRPTESAPSGPSDFPAPHYQTALARGEPIYRIDPAHSLVVIEIRRAGSLARIGHDHVVASHDLRGYVAPQEHRADLFFPLAELAVDEPDLRVEAGFDTHPTQADIDGTRRNMLGSVLDIDRYPFAVVAVTDVIRNGGDDAIAVAITLHGTTRTMRIPVRVEAGNEAIAVSGSVALKQTDFGITPLSILGGAVQVKDEISLRFRIRAERAVSTSREMR